MILKEQIYSNKRKIYYHGRKSNNNSSERLFDEFYITPRLEYSFPYAERNGIVEAYQFNREVDIFDLKSNFDEGVFRVFLQKIYPEYLRYIEDFKGRDWINIIGVKKRNEILNKLRLQRYDGYFNYEIDEKTFKKFHNDGLLEYTRNCIKSPTIGIFRFDCLDKIGEYKVGSLVDIDYERQYVTGKAIDYLVDDENISEDLFVGDMLSLTFGIEEDEIKEIFNSIKKEEIEERNQNMNECYNDLTKRWR